MTAFLLDRVLLDVSDRSLRTTLHGALLLAALGIVTGMILGAVAFDVEVLTFGLSNAWALDGSRQELISICGMGGNGLLVIASFVWGRVIRDLL